MIRLALSVNAPSTVSSIPADGQIRSAMDAVGHVIDFDAWLAGTIDVPANESPPSPGGAVRAFAGEVFNGEVFTGEVFTGEILAGGADLNVAALIRQRWIEHLSRNTPAMQPILSIINRHVMLAAPRVRVWQDALERALLSIWISPAGPSTNRVDSISGENTEHSLPRSTGNQSATGPLATGPLVTGLSATRPLAAGQSVATWLSLHRVGQEPIRFSTRDRQLVLLIHEQFSPVLRSPIS